MKKNEKGGLFAKNSLLVVSLTSSGRIHKQYILPADVREISKSMFAAQENIMSLFTCAHVYVRMCEGARMYMYACVKIFHWRLINI